MKTCQSCIKFNPAQFVMTCFNKIQALISGTKEKAVKAPIKEKPKKEKPVKKAPKAKKALVTKRKKPAKQSKKGSKVSTVLALIQDSPEGITTAELMEKTGLTSKQIWAIIYKTEKQGKIKKAKRGVYVRA